MTNYLKAPRIRFGVKEERILTWHAGQCTKERSHPTCQQNVRLTTAHLSQFNQPVSILLECVEAHKVVHSALRD